MSGREASLIRTEVQRVQTPANKANGRVSGRLPSGSTSTRRPSAFNRTRSIAIAPAAFRLAIIADSSWIQ